MSIVRGISPETSPKIMLTMSWDDGYPADLRVAELMARYKVKGTFYVPLANQEGLPVLSPASLRELASLHEIGSHTYDHSYLTSLTAKEAERQIVSGKVALEDILGKPVFGFSYPGGKFRHEHVSMVRRANFHHARCITNCRADLSFDRFKMPTTLQVYPHTRWVYARHFIRQGDWVRRASMLPTLMRGHEMLNRLLACVEFTRRRTSSAAVHFWGHSWELDRTGGWKVLEEFFQHVSEHPGIVMLQNSEVAAVVSD